MPRRLVLALIVMSAVPLLLAYQWFEERQSDATEEPAPRFLIPAILYLSAAMLIMRRHALGRQLGLWLAVLWTAFFMFGGAAGAFAVSREEDAIVGAGDLLVTMFLFAVPGIVVVWAFTSRVVLEWFGLRCSCGSYRVRSSDLVYRRLRCKACKRIWPRAQGPIDVRVFE